MNILKLFLLWRIYIFCAAIVSVIFIPEFNISFPYFREELIFTNLPYWIWGFGNFDGVHYIRIAREFYTSNYTQAFFPLYPLMIRYISFGNYFVMGLFISNLLFLSSLYVLYKLFRLDNNHKVSVNSLIFLLAFPTAFYFGSLYSESLFLLLSALSIYCVRKEKYILAGIFASFASATRILGFGLFLVLLVEVIQKMNEKNTKIGSYERYRALLGVFLSPIGGLIYMLFLHLKFNDAFYFLTSQPAFGAERSSTPFIMLPQVIYRYIKIILSVPFNSYQFFLAFSEVLFTIFPLVLLFFLYKKIRFSYLIFTLFCLILPTLTGTLSSMPRYALMIFLIIPSVVLLLDKYINVVVGFLFIFQAVLVIFFIRGFFVA